MARVQKRPDRAELPFAERVLCLKCASWVRRDMRRCGDLEGLCFLCRAVYDQGWGPKCPKCGQTQLASHDYYNALYRKEQGLMDTHVNLSRTQGKSVEHAVVSEDISSAVSRTSTGHTIPRRESALAREGLLEWDSGKTGNVRHRKAAQELREGVRAANLSRDEVYDRSSTLKNRYESSGSEDDSPMTSSQRKVLNDNVRNQISADTGHARFVQNPRPPRPSYDDSVQSQRRPAVNIYGRHETRKDRDRNSPVPAPGFYHHGAVDIWSRPVTGRDERYNSSAVSGNTIPVPRSRSFSDEEAETSPYSSRMTSFPTTTSAGPHSFSSMTRTSGPQQESFSSFPTTTDGGPSSFSSMTRTSGPREESVSAYEYPIGDRRYSDREQNLALSVSSTSESRQIVGSRSSTPPNAGLEGSTIGAGLAGIAVGAAGTLMWCTSAVKSAFSRR